MNTKERMGGIDFLRGIAVILMVEQHLGVWLWNNTWGRTSMPILEHPIFFLLNGLGGFAAPAFITLSGLGAALYLQNPNARAAVLIRRGLVLILFGYGLNVLIASWFTGASWYVLHMIGFGLILSPALSRRPPWTLVLLAVFVVLITTVLQDLADTPFQLGNKQMSQTGDAWQVLKLALLEGHFPVFPWLGYFLVGMAAANGLKQPHRWNGWPLALGFLAAGALLFGLSLILNAEQLGGPLERLLHFSPVFYPSFPMLAFLLMGAVLLALWVVMRWEQARPIAKGNPVVCLGRSSLSIIIVHIYAFRELGHAIGFWRSFTKWQTYLLILVTLAALAWFTHWWQKKSYRFGGEWLLRKVAG